ncbi:hypothetical protein ACMBCM_09265, partial [Spiroplasma sp. K1]
SMKMYHITSKKSHFTCNLWIRVPFAFWNSIWRSSLSLSLSLSLVYFFGLLRYEALLLGAAWCY